MLKHTLVIAALVLSGAWTPSAHADGPLEVAPIPPALTEAQQRLQLRVFELIDLCADGMPPKTVVDKLAADARTDLRPLFEVYAGVADRELDGSGDRSALEAEALLKEALLLVDFEQLAAYLHSQLEQGAGLERQLKMVELLAESDHPRSQELIAEALASFEPTWFASTRVSARVTAALSLGLAKHPAAAGVFARDPEALAPQLLPLIARAAPAGGSGAQLLQGLLEIDPGLDVVVLESLARHARALAGLGSSALRSEVAEQVRSLLSHEAPEVRARALVVLGYLTDPACIDRQIALLRDEDSSVRARAFWALREASGKTFGPEQQMWDRWFELEQAWLREAGNQTQRKLMACSDAEAVALIRELLGHTVYRHELSAMLAPVLFRENSAVVEAACSALEHLRAPSAIEYLIEGLEHADPACREVIHATLMRVTGLELPVEQAAWLAEFRDL